VVQECDTTMFNVGSIAGNPKINLFIGRNS
jgi:hypothetical protein